MLYVIAGPTAVGKSALAVKLAKRLGCHVVNGDSRQVYTELNIGTAKISEEEMEGVQHHLLGHVSIKEEYSAGIFLKEAREIIYELNSLHGNVIVCGGSGLYLKALLEGMDDIPKVSSELRDQINQECQSKGLQYLVQELKEEDLQYYNEVDLSNTQRVIRAIEVIRFTGKPFSAFRKKSSPAIEIPYKAYYLNMNRELLNERIHLRVDLMVNSGLIEEALAVEEFSENNALQTVGYSELYKWRKGEWSKEEAIERIKIHSRQYAKRQQTWFKKQSSFQEIFAGEFEIEDLV